jgi:serine/threonine protein kinase
LFRHDGSLTTYCEHSKQFCMVLRRDLKLENILLTAGGDVKLSDFGLGAVREAAAESHLLHTVR